MARTLEYIERRCAINEEVLHTLGELIGVRWNDGLAGNFNYGD